jgi:hypothetical protein
MRIMDIILAFPYILLAIVVVAYLGPSLQNAMMAIGITYVPRFARIVRGSVLEECEKDYVTAARAIGAKDWRIIFCHPAQLPRPFDRPDHPEFCLRHPGYGRFEFSGAGRPAAHTGMGCHDCQKPVTDFEGFLGDDLPGTGHPFCRAGFNLLGDGLRDALDPIVCEELDYSGCQKWIQTERLSDNGWWVLKHRETYEK